MTRGVRALLSDDIPQGKHYVHFIILASQHSPYSSPVQTCFFYGLIGLSDPISQCFFLREQHYGFIFVCTCMYEHAHKCADVSRLMTTGIRNTTD